MASILQSELDAGEQLLWSGQPQPRPLFEHNTFESWAVFLPLLGSIGFVLLAGAGNPPFVLLLGSLLVALALLNLSHHFWVKPRRRAHTHYALTNQRILILSGVTQQTIHTLPLKSLADLQLRLHANGSGSIFFNPIATGAKRGFYAEPQPLGFEHIPNARQVYELVRQAQRAAPDRSPGIV